MDTAYSQLIYNVLSVTFSVVNESNKIKIDDKQFGTETLLQSFKKVSLSRVTSSKTRLRRIKKSCS